MVFPSGSAGFAGNGAGAETIPSLRFAVRDGKAEAHAAVPTLIFDLEIEAVGHRAIRSILLNVQIQIAARQRGYDAGEQERLLELFGTPERWGNTLRTLLWTRSTVVVPPFSGGATVQVPIACSYDLEVAGARYIAALGSGEIPLEFLFSGSMFYSDTSGRLQTVRISWDEEAGYRLPVAVWREAMDRHFPDGAWIRLDRERFQSLLAYKARHAFTSWEAAIDSLLASQAEPVQ